MEAMDGVLQSAATVHGERETLEQRTELLSWQEARRMPALMHV